MSKDIFEYLHYYIGHTAMHPGLKNPQAITGRWMQSMREKRLQIKPILRKLESVTEEEASDVYTIERDRILHPPTNDVDVRRINNAWQIVRLDQLDTKLFVVDDGVVFKVTEDAGKPLIEYTRNMPLIFHYLLSRGFDLWNLIDAGLAIDKETIKS